VVGEADDSFQVRHAPPAIASHQLPETFGNPAVEAFEMGVALGFKELSVNRKADGLRSWVSDNRRKGTATAVVTPYKMEHKVTVMGFLQKGDGRFRKTD
jgi:hypothetical protein